MTENYNTTLYGQSVILETTTVTTTWASVDDPIGDLHRMITRCHRTGRIVLERLAERTQLATAAGLNSISYKVDPQVFKPKRGYNHSKFSKRRRAQR